MGDGLADEGVGVRHSRAILGCAHRLRQRIAVIWRQTKHQVLGAEIRKVAPSTSDLNQKVQFT